MSCNDRNAAGDVTVASPGRICVSAEYFRNSLPCPHDASAAAPAARPPRMYCDSSSPGSTVRSPSSTSGINPSCRVVNVGARKGVASYPSAIGAMSAAGASAAAPTKRSPLPYSVPAHSAAAQAACPPCELPSAAQRSEVSGTTCRAARTASIMEYAALRAMRYGCGVPGSPRPT